MNNNKYKLIYLSNVIEKNSLLQYATNKAAEQRSLISAFVARYLDRIIDVLAEPKLSRLQLVSVGEQAYLSLTWSKSSEYFFFSRDKSH